MPSLDRIDEGQARCFLQENRQKTLIMAIDQGGGIKLFGTTISGFGASAGHVAGGPAASGPMPVGAYRTQQSTTPNISQIADAQLKGEQRRGHSGGTSGNSSDTQQTACTASSPQALHERLAATAAQASVLRQAAQDGLRADSIAALRDAAEALQVLQSQPSASEAMPPRQLAAASSMPLALAAGLLAPPARVGESTAERQSRRRTSVQIQAQLPPNLKLCSSCRQVFSALTFQAIPHCHAADESACIAVALLVLKRLFICIPLTGEAALDVPPVQGQARRAAGPVQGVPRGAGPPAPAAGALRPGGRPRWRPSRRRQPLLLHSLFRFRQAQPLRQRPGRCLNHC